MPEFDYDKVVRDMQAQDEAESAARAVTPAGEIPTLRFDGTPSTAKAVLRTSDPIGKAPVFEEMGRIEQITNSFAGGFHNYLKGQALDAAQQFNEEMKAGLAGILESDDPDVLNDPAVIAAAKDPTVNKKYREGLAQKRDEALDDFIALKKKDSDYAIPQSMTNAMEATKGKDFWESVGPWLNELSKDKAGSAIYLFASSLGAIAPALAESVVVGRGLPLVGFKLNAVQKALSASYLMGKGSFDVELGSYIENALQEKGTDLTDFESVKAALNGEDFAEIYEKAVRRAAVVGAFDAIAGLVAPIRLNPSNAIRTVRNANSILRTSGLKGSDKFASFGEALQISKNTLGAPKSKLGGLSQGLENLSLQTGLQGVLGGAGEAFGQLVNGEEINWGDVFAEAFGELISAPVEVVTLATSVNAQYNARARQAEMAKNAEENVRKITAAVSAVSSKIGDEQTVTEWVNGLAVDPETGRTKPIFAFAQDLVDAGIPEKIREVEPQLAQSIEEAAAQKTDVTVPLSSVLKIAATDEATARSLIYESRIDADGMSAREAEAFMKDGKQEVIDQFDKIVNDAKPDIELRKQIDGEVKKITEQLINAGMAKDVAELSATPWKSYLAVRAKQTGLSPKEIMDKINLRVRQDGQRGGFAQQLSTALPSENAVASGDHPFVNDNFGRTAKNGPSGQNGTYPIHFEAYKRAAARLGVLPRELQSVTWEAVRVLFESSKKQSLQEDVEAIWKKFDKGQITADEAREQIFELAGGLSEFAWESTPFNDEFTETYDRSHVKLYDDITQPEPEPVLTLEAAPDPNNAEAVALWNQLSSEDKLAVTQEILPWILEQVALRTKTFISEPILQRGGYHGDPNYSMLCRIGDGGDYVKVAKLLASYLRQDTVMAISPKAGEGMRPSKVIRIQLPDGVTEAQIDDLYQNHIDKIRDANGNRLIEGQSTADGVMMLSVEAEHIDEIKAGIDGVMKEYNGRLTVYIDDAFSGFLTPYSEKEKKSASSLGNSGRDSGVQQETSAGYDADLQSETDQRLLKMVKAKAAERAAGANQNRTQGGFNQTGLGGFYQIRDAAQERLNLLNLSRRLDEQIHRWREGDTTEKFDLGAPSWVLQLFGVKDSSNVKIFGKSFLHAILKPGETIRRQKGKHGLTDKEVRGLLVGIQRPIAVFRSTNQGAKPGEESIVLLTEQTQNGKNVVVPLWLTSNINGTVVVDNQIPTAFAKSNIKQWVDAGLLLGYEKEKGLRVLLESMGSNRQQLGTSNREESLIDGAIVYQNDTSVGDLYQLGYHGSPYVFDSFTLSHIGSGQGAQSHGWGLYFALERVTAEGYLRKLTNFRRPKYHISDGRVLEGINSIDSYSADFDTRMISKVIYEITHDSNERSETPVFSAESVQKKAKEILARHEPHLAKWQRKKPRTDEARREKEYWVGQLSGIVNALKKLIESPVSIEKEIPGRLYTVDIPEDDVMLREGARLSDQPEKVRKMLEGIIKQIYPSRDWKEVFADVLAVESSRRLGKHTVEALRNIVEAHKEGIYSKDLSSSEQRMLDEALAKDIDSQANVDEDTKEVWAVGTRQILNLYASMQPSAKMRELTGRGLYRLLAKRLGSPKAASELLREHGILGMRYNGRQDGECAVVWDEESIKILETLEQAKDNGELVARGSFIPNNASDSVNGLSGIMTLMQARDKSTFLHESAHAWLDADTMLAAEIAKKAKAGEELTTGEKAFVKNLGGFFRWGQQEGVIHLGVTDSDESILAAVEQWGKLTTDEQRGMHELFARGFEAYLLEGISPNAEMKTIFGRFKKWLMDVYSQATSQPRPISKEVRKLYDLMFATEQQVQDTETKLGLRALFDGQLGKQLGMTEDELTAYNELNEQATQEAEGLVARAVHGALRIFGRVRRQEAARLEREHKKEIDERTESILAEPRYVAYKILTTGITGTDGGKIRCKFSRKGLERLGIPDETIFELTERGFVSTEEETDGPMPTDADGVPVRVGGVDPTFVASLASASDPIEMIGDLMEIQSLDDARAEAVREIAYKEKEETGQSFSSLSEYTANLAAYNETRSRFLTAEFNALSRALGSRQLMVSAAREYAVERVGKMKLSDVHPYAYMTAERRCAREAEVATRKGDFAAALEAKRGQILNHEMARAALEAKDRYDRGVRMARRALKSKTIHPQYKKLINALLEAHSIRAMTAKEREEFAQEVGVDDAQLADLVKALEDNGTPIDGLDGFLMTHEHAEDMTCYDSQDFFAALQQLVTIGRNILRQQLIADAKRVDEIVQEGREKLKEAADKQGRPTMEHQHSPLTKWEERKAGVMRFLVGHVKVQTMCRIFDQNKDNGFFWNLFIRSANDRANFEARERARVSKALKDALMPIFKKNQDEDPVIIPGFDVPFTHGMRIAVALNWGNESNRERLTANDPRFTDEAVQIIFEHLTEADWRAVESVWQLFESFRPAIAEKEKRVFGIEPEWIDYEPFEVRTAEGKTITVSGGYYPVKFDPVASNRVDKNTAAEAVEQEMKGAFQSATTRRSFTKSRVKGKVEGMPSRLDLSALYGGFNDVIHDLAWHEWLIDTKKVLDGVNGRDSGLRYSIKERYGYQLAKLFDDWRTDIATGGREEKVSDIVSFAAKNVGVSAMGYSLTSAFVQLTGAGYVIPRVGIAAFSLALGKYIANPFRVRRNALSKSEAMRLRGMTQFKELSQVKNRLEQGNGIASKFRDNAYFLMTIVQGIVDTICWQAAYERFTREGYSEKDCIAMSDQTVIDTQSSGNISDLSQVERNKGGYRLFTIFYTWMNAALNLGIAEYFGENNRYKAAAKLFFMGAVMPVIEAAYRNALVARGDDDDEDDEVKTLINTPLANIVEYHLGLFVGAREISGAAKELVEDEKIFDYSGPAGTRAFSNAVKGLQMVQSPSEQKMIKALIDLSGSFLGLPSSQINKTIKGIRAIESGQAKGLDAIKAPLFGFDGKVED